MLRTRSIAFVALASTFVAPHALASDTAGTTSTAPTTTHAPRYVPEHVVPGDVLLKLAGVDKLTLHRADFGDVRARSLVDAKVQELATIAPGIQYVRRLPYGWGLFRIPTTRDRAGEAATVDALAKLAARKDIVVGSAPNRWMKALRVPNDQFESLQWMLDAIGAPAAWDVTTGASGQTIGVVDTGTILEHEDLVGKDAGGFDFVSDPTAGNDGDGRDAVYEDPGDGCGSPEGDSFHGTHVAGTILANANNGIGIAGLNWSARLITTRVLGCGGGNTVDIMEGVAWLAGEADIPMDPNNTGGATVPALDPSLRPHVANLSLGGAGQCDQFSQQVTDVVTQQAGLVVVVAAGNDGGPVNSPGNCPSVIAVAAYGAEPDHPLTSYSSFGNEVAIVAPGGDGQANNNPNDDVLSCANPAVVGAGNAPYIFEEGTSMATPHVTGTVSLMLALNPSLTRDDIVTILQSTGDSCRNCTLGKLALRADRAIASVTNVNTSPGDACSTFCSPGQQCVSGTCALSCNLDGDCTSLGNDVCRNGVCVVNTSTGGGGGGGGGGGTVGGGGCGTGGAACDPLRGNLDCPTGKGCVVDGSGNAVCVTGADAGDGVGSLCSKDADCSTGLCDEGVCTVTCDFDNGACRLGYTCDQNAAPGGLCRPDSCRDQHSGFCGDFNCSYSPQQHYVCSKGPSNYNCSDVAVTRSSTPSAGVIGIGAMVAVLFVRRRRRS